MTLTPTQTLCRDLQSGATSAEAHMAETYDRIDAINPQVNALVGLLERDAALALAQAADEVPQQQRGPLHGLPMAPKDAVEVEGFATTWGFAPWANNIARRDDALAARMRAAGALFIGRSNMPEFGLGSNTFNNLYGRTLNPYDPTRTPGGSSGGAAVALATGMLDLADGSDLGGSLRNPASFCNVVGFRPSIGRMPLARGFSWLGRMATTGPMARTVADTALLFSVQAGPDISDPLSLPEPGETFLDALKPLANLDGVRIAYAPRLHGLPIDPAVLAVLQQAADACADLGAEVVDAVPPLEDAMDIFQTLRAAGMVATGDALDKQLPDWRTHAKDTAVWNIEKGQRLTASEVFAAEQQRGVLYAAYAAFMQDYDAVLLPAAQVPPFSHEHEWVTEIEGVAMETYLDWMTVCCAITVTGAPAISVPAGFTPDALPVGAQFVGKPRGDLALLRLAHCFEAATEFHRHRPAICALES